MKIRDLIETGTSYILYSEDENGYNKNADYADPECFYGEYGISESECEVKPIDMVIRNYVLEHCPFQSENDKMSLANVEEMYEVADEDGRTIVFPWRHTRTFYQVIVEDDGSNFECPTFDTLEEAEAKYNELLAKLEGTEKYHDEDNTNEWVFIEIGKFVVDEDLEPNDVDHIISSDTLRVSDYYYREALL